MFPSLFGLRGDQINGGDMHMETFESRFCVSCILHIKMTMDSQNVDIHVYPVHGSWIWIWFSIHGYPRMNTCQLVERHGYHI